MSYIHKSIGLKLRSLSVLRWSSTQNYEFFRFLKTIKNESLFICFSFQYLFKPKIAMQRGDFNGIPEKI